VLREVARIVVDNSTVENSVLVQSVIKAGSHCVVFLLLERRGSEFKRDIPLD
jgi:hypothetical protein